MEESLVDICRRGYDDYEEGKMDEVYAVLDPEIEFVHGGAFVTPQSVSNLDEYKRFTAEIDDTYETFDIVDRRYHAVSPNQVLLIANLKMQRPGEDTVNEREFAWLWGFRDGRFHRGVEYDDPDRARAEFGVS